MQFLSNLQQGIRNIIYWLPVIWRDRNWDYSHFLYILRHKLNAILLDIPNWTSAEKEKDAENIEYAIVLIDAIINAEYEAEAHEEHKRICGEAKITFEKIDDKFSKVNFIYPGEMDQEEARKYLVDLMQEALDKKQSAIDILFDIIRDNFETWWD